MGYEEKVQATTPSKLKTNGVKVYNLRLFGNAPALYMSLLLPYIIQTL